MEIDPVSAAQHCLLHCARDDDREFNPYSPQTAVFPAKAGIQSYGVSGFSPSRE